MRDGIPQLNGTAPNVVSQALRRVCQGDVRGGRNKLSDTTAEFFRKVRFGQALVRLFEQRGQLDARFDRQVVEDASLDDFDRRLVDRFVGPVDGGDRTAALAKLDMVAEDEAGVARPTVTRRLFGARWPQRWLPQAFIQSVAYRGKSVSEALQSPRYQLDAKDNDGPI